MTTTVRSMAEQARDTRATLETATTSWLASANIRGEARMIALSHYWDGTRLVYCTLATSRTVRDLRRTPVTRAALPSTEDVITVDGTVALAGLSAEPELITAFVERSDWDPRNESQHYLLIVLTPVRIQAFRNVEELTGRDVMRGGVWLA